MCTWSGIIAVEKVTRFYRSGSTACSSGWSRRSWWSWRRFSFPGVSLLIYIYTWYRFTLTTITYVYTSTTPVTAGPTPLPADIVRPADTVTGPLRLGTRRKMRVIKEKGSCNDVSKPLDEKAAVAEAYILDFSEIERTKFTGTTPFPDGSGLKVFCTRYGKNDCSACGARRRK